MGERLPAVALLGVGLLVAGLALLSLGKPAGSPKKSD